MSQRHTACLVLASTTVPTARSSGPLAGRMYVIVNPAVSTAAPSTEPAAKVSVLSAA